MLSSFFSSHSKQRTQCQADARCLHQRVNLESMHSPVPVGQTELTIDHFDFPIHWNLENASRPRGIELQDGFFLGHHALAFNTTDLKTVHGQEIGVIEELFERGFEFVVHDVKFVVRYDR